MIKSSKKIESNLEYLKKLFIMPDSPDKFIQFGQDLLEMVHNFFQEGGGIHSNITLPELSEIFNQTSIPGDPCLLKDVLAEIKAKIIRHSVKVSSPYYIGHMTSAVPYFMILLEMIIASLNQNQVKIETAKASSFVERELVAWLHRLIFKRDERFYKKNMQEPNVALGNVTSDGTLSNLTALLVAREKAFPPDGSFRGVDLAGVSNALRHYGYSRGIIIVSERGHYSIKKAAAILGIGEENVLTIRVDNNNRMDLGTLKRKITRLYRDDAKEKTKIIAIVGIAGTTETGNIDNLEELEAIAHQEGAHFHVDACWGGSTMLADEYRDMFRGIEKADSVSIDAHKLLYCPSSMGIVLFRDEKDLQFIRHTSQYIIRKNSVDTGRFTVEGSRPFACLKPWASLKIIGREGYRLLFSHARSQTGYFVHMLNQFKNFEMLNFPELFIAAYRFVPEMVREGLLESMESMASSGEPEEVKRMRAKIRKMNQLINSLNIRLHKALREDASTFVSRTTLESTRYRPQRIVSLRAVLINPLINEKIIQQIVSTHNRIGQYLWKEIESAFALI